MKKLVKFKLEDGSSVVFETDVPEENASKSPTRISKKVGSSDKMQEADECFESVAQRIRPAAQLVLDSLRELNSPKEISLEFGLKFSAKTGVIVASADSEVNFKVNVKWVNEH